MSKELVMTDYLLALRDKLSSYGITEVYSVYPFSNEREEGVNLYVNASFDVCNELSNYIDIHSEEEEWVPSEAQSIVLPITKNTSEVSHLVYKNGKFYE